MIIDHVNYRDEVRYEDCGFFPGGVTVSEWKRRAKLVTSLGSKGLVCGTKTSSFQNYTALVSPFSYVPKNSSSVVSSTNRHARLRLNPVSEQVHFGTHLRKTGEPRC